MQGKGQNSRTAILHNRRLPGGRRPWMAGVKRENSMLQKILLARIRAIISKYIYDPLGQISHKA